MGTVRTNMLIEVEDYINDLVVVPHKRNKTFGKLIAALLTGYIKDEYVRAYADGTISDLRKASVEGLESIIGDMASSISNLDMFGTELKENTQRGIQHFSETKKRAEQDLNDIDNLKGDVSELKSQNAQILEMLKMLSQGITVAPQLEVSVETKESVAPVADSIPEAKPMLVNEVHEVSQPQRTQTNSFVKTFIPTVVEDFKEDGKVVKEVEDEMPVKEKVNTSSNHYKELVNDYQEDDDAPDIDASNLLNSLMSGNQYSF